MEYLESIDSKFLSNRRSLWIIEPSDPAACTNLAIFLDGEFYLQHIDARQIIRKLRSSHAIADSWFVFVSHESMGTRFVECPCYAPFSRFISEEVLAFLIARFPRIGFVMNKVLIGLSYTGLAAAYVAWSVPGLFNAVVAQSGSFWSNDMWLVREFKKQSQHFHTRFVLDVGTKETEIDVEHRPDLVQKVSQIEAVREFRDVLLAGGNDVIYNEFEGGHDMKEWARILPLELQAIIPSKI